MLDLVALGIVADVVPLDANNRILAAQGLARLNAGVGSLCVRALLAVAKRLPGRITAMDLGLSPARASMPPGVWPTCRSASPVCSRTMPPRHQQMARELDTLNRERRGIEAGMQSQALAALESLKLDAAGLPRGLCLYDESWHQGVIGLVAARIKERVHRPVIAFARVNDQELKGSARSVAGLHVRDALDNIATRHPGLLSKFGGHAMAAGLTLARERFDAFLPRHSTPRSVAGSRTTTCRDGSTPTASWPWRIFRLVWRKPCAPADPGGRVSNRLFDGCFDVLSGALSVKNTR